MRLLAPLFALAVAAPFVIASCGLSTSGTGAQSTPTGGNGGALASLGQGGTSPSGGTGQGASSGGALGGSGGAAAKGGATGASGGKGGSTSGAAGSGATPGGSGGMGTGATGGTMSATGGATTAQGGSGGAGQAGTTSAQGGTGQAGTASGQGGGAAGTSSAGGSGPCQTPPGPCVASLGAGWKPSAFEGNRALSCPPGFLQADVVAKPTAMGGACGCNCTLAATCTTGTMQTYYSDSTSCANKGSTLDVSGPGCTSLGFVGDLANHFSAVPPGPVVSCAASTATDPTKLSAIAERVCEGPMACAEELCNGSAPAGFAPCVVHDGDVPCPGGWGNKTVVGSDATLSCSSCSCTASAACANGKIDFFTDDTCSQSVAVLDVNTKCVSSSGKNISAFEYTADVVNAKCDAMGPKMATVGLTGARTVCCK